MARSARWKSGLERDLQLAALRLGEVEEGIACQGTALECRTFKTGSKAFLFVSATEVRLKLGDSLSEATKLAAKSPDLYAVGAHGWVKVTLSEAAAYPPKLLQRWIEESYRLMAPKKSAAAPATAPKRRAKAVRQRTSPQKKR